MFAPRGAVRAAWRAVRRAKRLVFLVSLVDALACLPAALYVGLSVHRSAAHRTDSTEIARTLDLDFMADLKGTSGDFEANLMALAAATLVLFFFVRPLFMGGYVAIAARGDRIRFDEFIRVGGAVYWKFLRIACVGLFAAYALSLAASPLLDYIDEQAANFTTEGPALTYRRITEAVVFAAFWVMGTILDYTRVGVRLHRRPGVIAELFRSAVFVLQHPVDTLGFSALAFGIELIVIWAFSHVLAAMDGAYLVTSLVILLLVQVLVALREAARLFHHAGAWTIRRREEFGRDEVERVDAGKDDDLLANLPWNV
jgi:hypothetical protein